jgi:hypothetical protein
MSDTPFEAARKAVEDWCSGSDKTSLFEIVDDHMQAIVDALTKADQLERENRELRDKTIEECIRRLNEAAGYMEGDGDHPWAEDLRDLKEKP